MKQPIRAFSIGLFTASAILLVIFLFFQGDNTAEDRTYPLDELTEKVEEKGYRVVSEEDYITLSLVNDEQKTANAKDNDSKVAAQEEKNKTEAKKEDKDNNADKPKEDKKEKDSNKEAPKTYTLKIEEHMMPSEASKLLEKNKIIKNASDLDKYLEDNNISTRIQIGEHKLTSDMTIAEVANVITK